MLTFLKWAGIAVGVIILLIIGGVVLFFVSTNRELARTYEVDVTPIAIPGDSASLARGAHLSVILGCRECHGENLGGKPFIEEEIMALLPATNLTSGEGGIGASYSDVDMVRSIRHGVGPDGRSLWMMPSHDYWHLGDADLGAIIAYIRSVPPLDNVLPAKEVGPIGRMLFASGAVPEFLPASLIDHDGPRPSAPPVGVTAAYGEYLARPCQGCHKPDYAGGLMPGPDPNAPIVANLTPAGNLSGWFEQDFITALRTGATPRGHPLDPDYMPIRATSQMTDDELRAIFLFLQTLPPKESPEIPGMPRGTPGGS